MCYWELVDAQMVQSFRAHDDTVCSLAMHPKVGWARLSWVGCGWAGPCECAELPTTRCAVHGRVASCPLSPLLSLRAQGECLLTSSVDGTIKVWT